MNVSRYFFTAGSSLYLNVTDILLLGTLHSWTLAPLPSSTMSSRLYILNFLLLEFYNRVSWYWFHKPSLLCVFVFRSLAVRTLNKTLLKSPRVIKSQSKVKHCFAAILKDSPPPLSHQVSSSVLNIASWLS